jgi:toxin ParE1/3/4
MPIRSVEFHEAAATDYDIAFEWYLQRSPDAALRFTAEVERALTQISDAPQRWAAAPLNTHRFLLRHFPFVLIYRETASGTIQILAVAHTSRRPNYWKDRI